MDSQLNRNRVNEHSADLLRRAEAHRLAVDAAPTADQPDDPGRARLGFAVLAGGFARITAPVSAAFRRT